MFLKLIDLIVSPAFAQQAQEASKGQQHPLMAMMPFVLIFVIFYFLMIRPQKKKVQKEQEMISALGKGDEIVTKSGLIGTITGLTDKVMTLEIADNVKVKVLRDHVGGLSKQFIGNKKEDKN